MDYFNGTAVLNASGTILERYAYAAFGERRIMAADFSPRSTSSYAWDFAFQGQFRDLETGWYNYGYRFYVPLLGRWINRDPIGEEGGRNLYRYVDNDPPQMVDYLGLIHPAILILAAITVKVAWSTACHQYAEDKCDTARNGQSDGFMHCCVSCVYNKCTGHSVIETFVGGVVHELIQAVIAGNTWAGALQDIQDNIYGIAVSFRLHESCANECAPCGIIWNAG
jgi:RHS repeat-associated protein